jgi:hypothetical protein
VLHRFGDGPQVNIAVVQFTPGIADSDNGPAIEDIMIETLRSQPSAAREAVVVGLIPPFLTA